MQVDSANISADSSQLANHTGMRNPLGAFVALVLLISVVQLWIVTAGWVGWPGYSDDYSRLATGFLHGELSFLVRPRPELLALADPYDPKTNVLYRWHDAVLYKGRYYLYWGPVPALLIAAVSGAAGDRTPVMGDQYLVLCFVLGTTLLAAVLISQIKTRFFPRQPVWSAAIPILSLGLGTPALYMLARSAVYEAAISGGQFFLMAGLVAAWFALRGPRTRLSLLTLAGACWIFSAGTRVSLPPAIAAVTALTAWFLWRRDKRLAPLCALITPLVLGAAGLAWYNYARFGSLTEFGWHYQLQALDQRKMPASQFVSLHFLLPNFLFYFFNTPHWMNSFPYLLAVSDQSWMSKALGLYRRYRVEEVVGLAWSQPFLIFAPLTLVTMRSSRAAAPEPADDPERALRIWLISSLLIAAALAFAPIMVFGAVTTMRYLMDAVPCATVLAAFGYWQATERLARRPRLLREMRTAVRLIVAAQCVAGILFAFYGMNGQFINNNYPLFNALHKFFPRIDL
jgi:hypothetical protein